MKEPTEEDINSIEILFCSKYHYCDECPAKIGEIWYCGFEKIKDNLEDLKNGRKRIEDKN